MKNAIVKKNTMLINIVAPGAEMDAAARINHYHKISMQAGEVAIKAALEVGMSLFQEKVRRQGTFLSWVEQNCDFSKTTAYRYLNLLQQSIGSQNDLMQLSDMSAKMREATIDEFASTVESKTLSELMCDYGIITKSKSNLGGKREGAGRKRKDSAAELAEQAEKIANSGELAKTVLYQITSDLYTKGVVEGGFGSLETADLKGVVQTIKDILGKANEILKSRKS